MAVEMWVEPKSHYKATGMVSGGRMTNATIDDNNGITRDRGRSFDSEADFAAWAKQDSGMA